MKKKEKIYKRYQKILVCILEFLIKVYDKDTWLHVKRIKLYSEVLAKDLGCSNEFIVNISLFSSLHDVGKVFIPKKILTKNDKLTKDEFNIMKKHSFLGERILFYLGIGEMARNIAMYHHEHFDGNGYPLKLKGEVIPLEARIVALVDVYDALRQERCYKKSISHKEAIEIIKKQWNKQFDKNIIKIFLKNQDIFDKIFNNLTMDNKDNMKFVRRYFKKNKVMNNDKVV